MMTLDDLKRALPLAALPEVTSGLVCRVEPAGAGNAADFSTTYGRGFRVLNSFSLTDAELRREWDRLLSCRPNGFFSPHRAPCDLAIQLFRNDEWVGAAEVRWKSNIILLLLDGLFCVPAFYADAPSARDVRRRFDERLS